MTRILVVDDEDQTRELLRELLTEGGYEVIEAADGSIAMTLVRLKPPDLIITDLIMPNQEGLETISEIRKNHPTLGIIAISGGGRIGPESYLAIAERLGASRTFSKPLDVHRMMAAVRELLKERTACNHGLSEVGYLK